MATGPRLLTMCAAKRVAAVSFPRLAKLWAYEHCQTVNFEGVSFGLRWFLASTVLFKHTIELVVAPDALPGIFQQDSTLHARFSGLRLPLQHFSILSYPLPLWTGMTFPIASSPSPITPSFASHQASIPLCNALRGLDVICK
uniref:Putative secreted protein n=1 Tax=Ixodes ricinus TaxID=34613 RepID=A0A6B0UTK8_IXORI